MDTIISLLSLIGAVIIIGIIIMVHELGHYSVGRKCKIKIVEFAVGFGPKIKSWVKNDIIYSVRWIFLGGFTKFYGEDDELDDKDAFNKQPAGRRALTIAAGPVFNILFAFILAIIILCAFGDYVTVVGEVWEDSPAEQAGLEVGDIIVEMNDVKMDFYMEIGAAQRNAYVDHMPLTVFRNGEEVSLDMGYQFYEEYDRNMAGFSYGPVRKHFGFFEAIGKSFRWMYVLLRETLIALAAMLAAIFGVGDRAILRDVSGIVKIVDMIGEAIRTSFENVLRLGVMISVSLAIFNIIPFPALDGGRLVFIGIEKATGKPVPRKVEGIIHFIGFIILIGLMILLMYKDIASWFSGG